MHSLRSRISDKGYKGAEMRTKIFFLSSVFIIALLFSRPGALANNYETAVKSALNNLLDLSKSKSLRQSRFPRAYDGDDKNRITKKDSFNGTIKMN